MVWGLLEVGVSVNLDDPDHELTTEDLLRIIANQLIILNARFEDQYESGLNEEDIDGILE